MLITLNITPAVRQVTGIGTYAKELTQALLKLDKENKYTLFFSRIPLSKILLEKYFAAGGRVSLKIIGLPYRFLNFLWNELGVFPVEYLCGECNIFHSLDMLSPLAKKSKVITTVHDLNWLVFNDNTESKKRVLCREVSASLKRSSLIIADSIFTKEELLKHFPFLKEADIEVVHLGVSDRFQALDRALVEDVSKKYGWGEFILYIGVLDQSRKNLIRLVNAYSKLKKERQIREKLVLCGRTSKNSNELLKLIDALNLDDDIIIHDKWISDEDMPVFYNMARALIYPSLYEGFGLPVLEAMACGKPVITSRLASIPEVAGDAAYYINPYDVDDIAKGIKEVLTEPELYSKLVEKGLSCAKKFTWEETAKKTLGIYKKVFHNR